MATKGFLKTVPAGYLWRGVILFSALACLFLVSWISRKEAPQPPPPSQFTGQAFLEPEPQPAPPAPPSENVPASVYAQPSKDRPPSPPEVPLRRVKGAGKKVALTFDDGPCPQWTEKYLQVLREHQVKATFFMIGTQVEAQPHLVKAVLEEGHEVGNHSWQHGYMAKMSAQALQEDFSRARSSLEKAGVKPRYFRPPYCSYSPAVLSLAEKEGQLVVLWDVDTRDWTRPSPQVIVDNVLNNVQEGSIILFHEGKPGTLEALPRVIKELKVRGYEMVTLSQLMAAAEGR